MNNAVRKVPPFKLVCGYAWYFRGQENKFLNRGGGATVRGFLEREMVGVRHSVWERCAMDR
jgi:hypothetical protein